MATSCVKPFVFGTFAPLKRPDPRSGLLNCTDPTVVARSARKRLAVCACFKNSASLRQRAEELLGHREAKPGFLAAAAASLLANLTLVGNAGALDDEEALSAYEDFVTEAGAAVDRVADTVTERAADAGAVVERVAETVTERAADVGAVVDRVTERAADAVPPDVGEVVSDVTEFTTEDILILGGALVFAVAVLFGISRLFRKEYAGDISAQDALRRLDKETSSILVDIRQPNEIAEEGSPKLPRGKKTQRIRFEREYEGTLVPHPSFVSRVQAKSASKGVPVFVIDTTGGVSVSAAKTLTKAGFKKVYAVKGGTEAWLANELPWLKSTNFKLDLTTLKQAIDDTVKENPNVVPATLGIAAATAGGFLLFSEAETAVQLLGSMVIAQLIINKLLFSEDRQKTVGQLKSFLDTKEAPQDLMDEFEEVRGAFFRNEAPAETSFARPPKSENGAASRNGAASEGYWSERRPGRPAVDWSAPPEEDWFDVPVDRRPARPAENWSAPPEEDWFDDPEVRWPTGPAAAQAVEPSDDRMAEQSTNNDSEPQRPKDIPPRLDAVKPFFPSYEDGKEPASNGSSKW